MISRLLTIWEIGLLVLAVVFAGGLLASCVWAIRYYIDRE